MMLTKPAIHLGALAVVLAAASPGAAQQQPRTLSYAVKFICGESSEQFQEGVVKGVHATGINIHNPSLQERATLRIKVARALPSRLTGTVTPFDTVPLDANQAVEVECDEIRQMLPEPMTRQFRAGFLVILSETELDVTAVYSSRPGTGEVSAIDIQVIEPRQLKRRLPQPEG